MSIFTYVNLENYLNHKAILETNDLAKNSKLNNLAISPSKLFFKTSTMPESNKITNANSVQFQFPEIDKDKYDNVQCAGQIINVPEGIYNKVAILFFSELFNHYIDIKFVYDDGSNEIVEAYVMGWLNAGYATKEKNDIKSRDINSFEKLFFDTNCNISVLNAKDTNDHIVACTYFEYKFDHSKKLIEVILPKYELVHLFSITFVKDI